MDKKYYEKILIFVICIFVCAGLYSPSIIYAGSSTSYTYTISVDGIWTLTQDAYIPAATILNDSGLKSPEDIFIFENKIYIADTGNSRIFVYDLKTSEITTLGEGILNQPSGVFVNSDGIYVADRNASAYKFNHDGSLMVSYIRPSSPAFGKTTPYKPSKISSDGKGNVYVVSLGTYQGMIQFSDDGVYNGFFGANATNITFLELMQNMFFTEEQKSQLFKRIPKTFSNIAIDNDKHMVYSLTPNTAGSVIKKHSVSGNNILTESKAGRMVDEANFIDLAIGETNEIYAVTETGLIFVYDPSGMLLFTFGGGAISKELNGYATRISGIATDDAGCLYLLDVERGLIHTYIPTKYADLVLAAIEFSSKGDYISGRAAWNEVLRLSATSRAAFTGNAKGFMQLGDYEHALVYYREANDKPNYSEAFWEIRNIWLNNHMNIILFLIIGAYLLSAILKNIDKRKKIFDGVRRMKNRMLNIRLISELGFMKYVILHPLDCFYYIKRKERVSTLSAGIVMLLGLMTFTLDMVAKGFLFNNTSIMNISPLFVFSVFAIPAFLWIVSNYMVSGTMAGEGDIGSVFRGTAYALSPYVLLSPVIILLTHFLTLNERFIIDFSTFVVILYCVFLMIASVKEIHNYTFKETVLAIFIILFLMVIIVLAVSLVYMLWSGIFDLVYTLVKEAFIRVSQ